MDFEKKLYKIEKKFVSWILYKNNWRLFSIIQWYFYVLEMISPLNTAYCIIDVCCFAGCWAVINVVNFSFAFTEILSFLLRQSIYSHSTFTEIPACPIWQLIRLINETMDDTDARLTGTSLVGWKVYNVVIVSFGDRVYHPISLSHHASQLLLSAHPFLCFLKNWKFLNEIYI